MDEGISEGQSLRSKLWAAVAQSKAIRAKEMQEKMRSLGIDGVGWGQASGIF